MECLGAASSLVARRRFARSPAHRWQSAALDTHPPGDAGARAAYRPRARRQGPADQFRPGGSFTYENDTANSMIAESQTRAQARVEGRIEKRTAQEEAASRERALNAENENTQPPSRACHPASACWRPIGAAARA